MSKAVLISIRPKWCELIASGEKTIEVRKTRPKQETPFKCYIYCTKPSFEYEDFIALENGRFIYGGGKVIGEFVCDKIFDVFISCSDPNMKGFPFPGTGLTGREIMDYLGNGKYGYGWHISDLVIYEDPKQLSEFMKPCNPDPDGIPLCLQCKRLMENYGCGGTILRPPQSYCYVEELG